MRKIAIAIGMFLVMMFGALGTAQANTNCNYNVNAGCIYNNTGSDRDLLVCEDWSGTSSDPGCWVYSETTFVNQGSWSPYYDSDGFYNPSGCNAYEAGPNGGKWYYSTGWHKVQNGSNHNIRLHC